MDDDAQYRDLTLSEFSDRLASAQPVPGGGSASALAGSMAAALLAMVSRLSAGRPKYEQYATTHARALEVAEVTRTRLLDLADEDARAYAAFGTARKMPRDTADEQAARDEATHVAARGASEVPLAVVRECARIAYEAEAMAGRSNLNAASDLEVAARLATAAARGAAANVLINLPMVGDDSYSGRLTVEVDDLIENIERAMSATAQRVAGGALREPEQA